MQVQKGHWLQVCPRVSPLSPRARVCPRPLGLSAPVSLTAVCSTAVPGQRGRVCGPGERTCPVCFRRRVTSELSVGGGALGPLEWRLPAALDSGATPGPLLRPALRTGLARHWGCSALTAARGTLLLCHAQAPEANLDRGPWHHVSGFFCAAAKGAALPAGGVSASKPGLRAWVSVSPGHGSEPKGRALSALSLRSLSSPAPQVPSAAASEQSRALP